MSAAWVIFKKEFIDNIRDKRSLFFSLLYGPLLMPLMVMGPFVANVKKHNIDFEEPKQLHVVGIDRAPGLIEYLYTKNIDAVVAPKDYEQAIKDEQINVVLEIPDGYAEQFTAGVKAQLHIYYHKDNDDSGKIERQLRNTLEGYERSIRAARIAARGIDDRFLDPLDIVRHDLAIEQGKGAMIGRLYMFVILISMMMGGFYLAVDSGAGEKERNSLEPLMSLPIGRLQIVLGKLLALLSFVLFATVFPMLLCYFMFSLLPVELLSSMVDASLGMLFKVFVVVLPLACLFPAFLMCIGSYAANTKEAQTHMGFAMMVPMLPFFALQFWNITPSLGLMSVPVLSQFVLMEKIVAGEAIELTHLFVSIAGTLLVTAVLIGVSVSLYKRDQLLR